MEPSKRSAHASKAIFPGKYISLTWNEIKPLLCTYTADIETAILNDNVNNFSL